MVQLSREREKEREGGERDREKEKVGKPRACSFLPTLNSRRSCFAARITSYTECVTRLIMETFVEWLVIKLRRVFLRLWIFASENFNRGRAGREKN